MEVVGPATTAGTGVYFDPGLCKRSRHCRTTHRCVDCCPMGVFVKVKGDGVYPEKANSAACVFCATISAPFTRSLSGRHSGHDFRVQGPACPGDQKSGVFPVSFPRRTPEECMEVKGTGKKGQDCIPKRLLIILII